MTGAYLQARRTALKISTNYLANAISFDGCPFESNRSFGNQKQPKSESDYDRGGKADVH